MFLLQKVDLGIADLSITYEREQAVDFSLPFMNTGTDYNLTPFSFSLIEFIIIEN
jgi:ABC-type amino acid transport substrate-binding protein